MASPLIPGFRLGIYVFKDAETFITEIARVMEYHAAYERYRDDVEMAEPRTLVGIT